MAANEFKYTAKSCLEGLGYAVTVIEEDSKAQAADLLAESVSDTLIVEVKEKSDGEQIYEALKTSKPRQQVPHRDQIKYQSRLHKIIKEASKQIQSTRKSGQCHHAFGIMWFHSKALLGFDDSIKQIKLNLYGGRYAFVDGLDGSHLCWPCYGTTYSDFYSYPDIEGVVLSVAVHDKGIFVGCNAELLPNLFSKQRDDFKNTHIYREFKSMSALWTPMLDQEVFYIQGNIDLKNHNLIIRELEKQNPGHSNFRFVNLQSLGGMMNL